MKIQWKNSDEYYHTKLDGTFDKKEAIKQLILKILELSKDRESWNLVVIDKWVYDLGRLIGNIQNDDQAIGMDRGYRVAVQFLDYYEKLENSLSDLDEYNYNLEIMDEELEELIIDIIHEEDFKAQLMEYYEKNPFMIEISKQGQRTELMFEIA